MTPDQLKCIQLRDCFYAGYSMPQYCVDNGIKKPLIASYDPEFLWELYVQFWYDKRMLPKFCLLSTEPVNIMHGVACTIGGIRFDKINYNNLDGYDKLFILTINRMPQLPSNKTIYLDMILGDLIKYVYSERPLYSYINEHEGISVILTDIPILKDNEHTTEIERENLEKNIHQLRDELKNRGDKILKTRFDSFGYTNDEVYAILALSNAKINSDGTSDLIDNSHPLVMTENGVRKTAYQDGIYKNTIWCMGTCIYYGIGAPYDKTIESYLQKIINENGHEYIVENVSQFYAFRYQDIFYNLNRLPVKKGDIVLICLQGLKADKIPLFNVSGIFDRPHEYGEVFTDRYHLNERGNQIFAKKFFEYLQKNNFFKSYDYKNIPTNFPTVHQYGIVKSKSGGGTVSPYQAELEQYKSQLRALRPAVGSIVMNCNPFTLGHRYLVEYAASRVERLYIFVVEEDKSIFPFADRIELVKKGTADLKNVTVLPSGKFIISSLTFSGYFNKAELQDSTVDPSMDVELFGREIAPQLGITVRFAGEEPLDNVTRQYNETMARILPQYGVKFEVIPRKETNGGVISASRVRKLLEESNFEEIEKLVPETTLEYLIEKYRKE